MRDEFGRARRRGGRILTPDGVASPMDLNPTLEVSAAIIADCVQDAEQYRRANAALIEADQDTTDPTHPDALVDKGMRDAATGRPPRRAQRDTA